MLRAIVRTQWRKLKLNYGNGGLSSRPLRLEKKLCRIYSEDNNEKDSEITNHFTLGRLNYKDSAAINSEIISAKAAYMAAEEARVAAEKG